MATFQYLEQRDNSDNITRQGVVSKSTAYATSDNQGAYDTIAADLNYLGDKTSQLENTVNNAFFEIDSSGNIMPSDNPLYSDSFELDSNGDIMPKLAS